MTAPGPLSLTYLVLTVGLEVLETEVARLEIALRKPTRLAQAEALSDL